MKKLLVACGLFSAVFIAAQTSHAQPRPYTPEKGSPERKAILDAVRKFRKAPNEVYTPYGFNVMQRWAMVAARDPNDLEVDTEAFEYVLRKTGGSWKVVDQVSNIEGTDPNKEIKRIRRKYPSLPAAVLDLKVE
ncbi:MAG: hypothetical protein ABI878_10240 [Acidobacteriota bacterium]